jgi:hypothetical protein
LEGRVRALSVERREIISSVFGKKCNERGVAVIKIFIFDIVTVFFLKVFLIKFIGIFLYV